MERIWQKNYPQGVPFEIDSSAYSSIPELISDTCKKFKDKTSFINMGSELSFSELDELSSDFASFLQQKGLQKGDRIALQMPNLLQYPIALFGALKAGLVIVNINPLYTPREMKHHLSNSGAKAIVILSNFAHHLETVIANTNIKTVIVTQLGDQLGWPKSLLINFAVKHIKKMVPKYELPEAYSFYEALDIGAERHYTPATIDSEDVAFLQYTGGTTGVSKGAMLTHRNIISNMLQAREWMKPRLVEGEEMIVTALPLYHIFALTVNCLSIFSWGGCNLIITNPRDIPGFVKTLKKYKFTAFSGVNTLFSALLNNKSFRSMDFSNLKVSVGGGMALHKSVAEEWTSLTKSILIEGYGLTESSPLACCNPIDGTDRIGTIGMPVPSTDIKFVNGDGEDVAPEEGGEICIKGPQVMKGYWQAPEETQKVMLDGGWLRTGDIGAVDSDGFFKIIDRKKDMILVSGFNVYPNEIEDVIANHSKVLEVAAIGVPDEKSGEAIKVFVVPKDKNLNKEEVLAICKAQLVAYKRPKYIEFRKELPKTNVGKILRRALREEPTASI